jgi:anti-sigma factor RsiW
MTEPELLALIHAELDGQLDPQQRAELARRVLADPEARAAREDLLRLGAMLEVVGDVEPPAELKANVLKALPVPVTPRSRVQWPAARWRYAALVAGVMGAATLVYETVDGPGPASGEVAGTMAARRTQTLDTVTLGGGPVSGRVSLYRDGSGLGLALELASTAPVDVVVASDGQTLTVNGLGTSAETRKVALPRAGTGGKVDLTFLMSGREVARATLTAAGGH